MVTRREFIGITAGVIGGLVVGAGAYLLVRPSTVTTTTTTEGGTGTVSKTVDARARLHRRRRISRTSVRLSSGSTSRMQTRWTPRPRSTWTHRGSRSTTPIRTLCSSTTLSSVTSDRCCSSLSPQRRRADLDRDNDKGGGLRRWDSDHRERPGLYRPEGARVNSAGSRRTLLWLHRREATEPDQRARREHRPVETSRSLTPRPS